MDSRQVMAASGGTLNLLGCTTAGFALFGATTITNWLPLLVPALCFATISAGDLWLRLRKLQKKAYAKSAAKD
jgi:hypothetical protein